MKNLTVEKPALAGTPDGTARPSSSLRHRAPRARLARMSTRSSGPDLPVRRIDRILAYMALGLTVLSIVCFFAVILAKPLGIKDFSEGLWPLVVVLPIAFVMIVVLLIMSFVRRSRAGRGA